MMVWAEGDRRVAILLDEPMDEHAIRRVREVLQLSSDYIFGRSDELTESDSRRQAIDFAISLLKTGSADPDPEGVVKMAYSIEKFIKTGQPES